MKIKNSYNKNFLKRLFVSTFMMILLLLIFVPQNVNAATDISMIQNTTKKAKKEVGISLNRKKVTLRVGEKVKIKATKYPSNSKVTWKTSNKRVATVSKGTIKGIRKGKATITAKIKVKGKTYKRTCKVIVKESYFDVVKKYLLKNSRGNSTDDLFIYYEEIESDGDCYRTKINYDKGYKRLRFTVWMEFADIDTNIKVSFNLYKGENRIWVKQLIIIPSLECACRAKYTVPIEKYYNSYGLDMTIVTAGELKPKDYEEMLTSIDTLSFIMWDELLYNEIGIGLKELGFLSYE